MKLEHQVCTLEQAKRLKELGVVQDSVWMWVYPKKEKMISTEKGVYHHLHAKDIIDDNEGDEFDHEAASAWGVAELGVALGKHVKDIFLHGPTLMWTQQKGMNPDMWQYQAHCYANWLIHLLENKLITPESVNDRLQNS